MRHGLLYGLGYACGVTLRGALPRQLRQGLAGGLAWWNDFGGVAITQLV